MTSFATRKPRRILRAATVPDTKGLFDGAIAAALFGRNNDTLALPFSLRGILMLDGFSISGYRSFGRSGEKISDLSEVNVFIGRNNSGKSNILRFLGILEKALKQQRTEKLIKLDTSLDYCHKETTQKIEFELQVKESGFTSETFDSVKGVFGSEWERVFSENSKSLWFSYLLEGGKISPQTSDIGTKIVNKCNSHFTEGISSRVLRQTGGSHESRAQSITHYLFAMLKFNFHVHYIETFRKISAEGKYELSGSGLIQELRKIQNPALPDRSKSMERFGKINDFLKSLLGTPYAKLEIPAEEDQINVVMDEKILPLESLGTGIHELIILAAAVTLHDNSIFCIEEPEIHLHPDLQKKFIRYIMNNTTNQYFISTHSNALFDIPGVNIYKCSLVEGKSRCQLVSTRSEKFGILQDLGYRPSDLLQANYVIWVEGPSDRIYIKSWIEKLAPDLVEGEHYAIMFYGGRLLSHLAYDSLAEDMVDDFIKLSRLNRSACIVMDSDKKFSRTPLNETKKRVKKDFEDYDCFVWITKGKTIENYIEGEALNEAVLEVHPKAKKLPNWEQFTDVTLIGERRSFNKVAVARKIISRDPNWNILDLKSKIEKLVAEIRRHNATEEPRIPNSD